MVKYCKNFEVVEATGMHLSTCPVGKLDSIVTPLQGSVLHLFDAQRVLIIMLILVHENH